MKCPRESQWRTVDERNRLMIACASPSRTSEMKMYRYSRVQFSPASHLACVVLSCSPVNGDMPHVAPCSPFKIKRHVLPIECRSPCSIALPCRADKILFARIPRILCTVVLQYPGHTVYKLLKSISPPPPLPSFTSREDKGFSF